MITITEVKSQLLVPGDGIGFVVMQPYLLGRVSSQEEPFKWKDEEKAEQLDRIRNTLKISLENLHNCEKTHFTIFPEYALPGLGAIETVESFMREDSWPCGTVVIGGLDGLTKDEYATLCAMDGVSFCEPNSPTSVHDGQWINCCVIWEKTSTPDGEKLNKFVQAKMSPSGIEELIRAQDMFCGSGMYIIEGTFRQGPAFRFLTTICYDWIGVMGDNAGIFAILDSLNSRWNVSTDPKMIDLVLLIQCNEKPNDPSFLENSFHFFDRNRFPYVTRDNTVIAMFNAAKSENPVCCRGDSFGSSSLVFSPSSPFDVNTDPPTYAVKTKALRNSQSLLTCKDALFREAGECVHSFSLTHPRFADRASQYPRLPICRAVVSPLTSGPVDPRKTHRPIDSSVKWINDQLDGLNCLESELTVINTLLRASYESFINDLRSQKGLYIRTSISSATKRESPSDIQINCDLWDEDELKVLNTWSAAVSLIGCSSKVSIGQGTIHGLFKHGNDFVEIVVVVGEEHPNNIRWADSQFPLGNKHKRLIISRDRDDNPSSSLDRERPVYDVPGGTVRRTLHRMKQVLSAADKEDFLYGVSKSIGTN